MTNIATLFVGFGMFGSFLLIPQLAELPESTGFGFGLGATGAGLLMLPGALVMLVRRPALGRARHALRLQAAARDRRRDHQRSGCSALGARPRQRGDRVLLGRS